MDKLSLNRSFQAIDTWVHRINRAGAVFSALIIMAMILTTMTDVGRRTLFKEPIAGIVEFNEIFMVLCVFLAMAYTQQVGGHIKVELVTDRLRPKQVAALQVFACLVALTWFAILSKQTLNEALVSFSIKEYRWGAIIVPIWWAKFFLPLGCWLICVQLVTELVKKVGALMPSRATPTAEVEAVAKE